MRPEMPFLAAGALAIGAGFARDKAWPENGTKALIGTLLLVIVASATSGSSFAPLVRAFGMMLFLMATMTAIPAFPLFSKKGN